MEALIPLITQYGYLILFPLVVIEGPVVALVAGFLVFLGHFHFWPTLAILTLADLTSDAIYYSLGRYGNRYRLVQKYGSGLGQAWLTHPRQMMFFGKFAYGVSVPIIVSAGVAKLPIDRFLLYALPATIVQYGGILVTSYLLGESYRAAEKYIFYIGIVVLCVLILIGVRFWKHARQKVNELKGDESANN